MDKNIDIRTAREPIAMTNNEIKQQKKQILDSRKLIFIFKENIYNTVEEKND